MHAIIVTGGKQYKVAEGETLFIEKLPVEAGDNVTFDKVLHKEKEKGGGVGGSYRFQATIHTNDAVELRPDGNNVDSDVESMKLYENYVRTQYLYTKISGQFANMNYVLDQTAK